MVKSKYVNFFSQLDYLNLMYDRSSWIPGLYESNLQPSVIWKVEKDNRNWEFQRIENMIAEIVHKSQIKIYGS